MASKEARSNTWTFVGYPGDSLPDYYLSICQSWHIPVLISPTHDKDKNGDETEKKKHIHFMIYFGVGQNKSFNQVKQFTDQLHATYPQIVHNTNALIRYFIHLDNPEKKQYSKNDIISLSGFEYYKAFENYSSEQELYAFIEDYIEINNIINLFDLLKILKYENLTYEAYFVRTHVYFFDKYINSFYQKCKKREILDITGQRSG